MNPDHVALDPHYQQVSTMTDQLTSSDPRWE